MHGLPVLEQEVGSATGSDSGSAQEESPQATTQAGWGLGGTGPVLKTQTIVSVCACEETRGVLCLITSSHKVARVVGGW